MGSLIIRVGNAQRQPLHDQIDVQVVSSSSDALVRAVRGVPGNADIRVEGLNDHQPYVVKVFPTRHRPVGQFAIPRPGDPTLVQFYTPLHPDRATPRFPEYTDIPVSLRTVLERSVVEGVVGTGEAAYRGLADAQKAGLFNLFAKMSSFGFDEQRTVWTFVDQLYRIRADRVFVDVQPALRDMVKSAVAVGRFREVSGKLHTPPPACVPAGSFKSEDDFGNLQLSFFVTEAPPLAFKVDADIDDAAGLGHAFQVLRNFITKGTTHPYDIHEILVFRQEVTLPYDLA